MTPSKIAKHTRLTAILLRRGLRCLSGDAYHCLASIHEQCPVCDLKFGREPGYFAGAMDVSSGSSAIRACAGCTSIGNSTRTRRRDNHE